MFYEVSSGKTFFVMLSDDEAHHFELPCNAFEQSRFFNSRLSGRWQASELGDEEVVHTFRLNAAKGDDAILLEHKVSKALVHRPTRFTTIGFH